MDVNELMQHLGALLDQQPAQPHQVLQVDPMRQLMLQQGAMPTAKPQAEIIPPSSPNVAKAITRVRAWMQERAQREPQPALERNIQIMMRGGPMAEAMAQQMLKLFQPHPSEALPRPPAIEGRAEK